MPSVDIDDAPGTHALLDVFQTKVWPFVGAVLATDRPWILPTVAIIVTGAVPSKLTGDDVVSPLRAKVWGVKAATEPEAARSSLKRMI